MSSGSPGRHYLYMLLSFRSIAIPNVVPISGTAFFIYSSSMYILLSQHLFMFNF